jgi:hypothetical protein
MESTSSTNWRYGILVLLMLGSLFTVMSLEPIPQNLAYHDFADQRIFLGIPNVLNVISNLPFLLVGVLGLRYCIRADLGVGRSAWIVLFAGVSLVSVGSAYYHWAPSNGTLLWDRIPMTVGFMGLFAALLGEYVNHRLPRWVLTPAVLVGIASVLYWHWTDDLRPYAWVQFFPLLTIPVVMVLFRPRYTHAWLLLVSLGWYVLAKVTEYFDASIFELTRRVVSGHSMKHVLAAAGCCSILLMLQKRRPTSVAAANAG